MKQSWSGGPLSSATQKGPLFRKVGPEFFACNSAGCFAFNIWAAFSRNLAYTVAPLTQ